MHRGQLCVAWVPVRCGAVALHGLLPFRPQTAHGQAHGEPAVGLTMTMQADALWLDL